MMNSVRDLIITGWAIVFVVTIGVVAFHPSFTEEDGLKNLMRIGGFALIATTAGIVLVRFTELLGRSSSRARKFTLGIFVVCMLPLVPVALATFGMPWGALIVITLFYVRWRWALVPSAS
jgi:hypothetical protein